MVKLNCVNCQIDIKKSDMDAFNEAVVCAKCLIKLNYKLNMNNYKEKIKIKKEVLEKVLKYGEDIEKETNGKNPNWKEVYNTYIKK